MLAYVIGIASGKAFCARDRRANKAVLLLRDGRCSRRFRNKARLEHPSISPALQEEVTSEVLAFGYASADRTLFRNIAVMPGHHLVVDVKGTPPQRHLSKVTGCSAPEKD